MNVFSGYNAAATLIFTQASSIQNPFTSGNLVAAWPPGFTFGQNLAVDSFFALSF
jgi:hypothetical protein